MATLTPSPLSLTVSDADVFAGLKSIRERIMDLIKLRLETVSLASGYRTDCGQRVDYGKLIDTHPPTLPMFEFWDGEENTTKDEYGDENNLVTVSVEAFDRLEDDSRALPAVSNELLADAKKAIARNHVTGDLDPTFGGLADGLAYRVSELTIGTGPSGYWVGFLAQWEITYRTPLGDPYTLPETE